MKKHCKITIALLTEEKQAIMSQGSNREAIMSQGSITSICDTKLQPTSNHVTRLKTSNYVMRLEPRNYKQLCSRDGSKKLCYKAENEGMKNADSNERFTSTLWKDASERVQLAAAAAVPSTCDT